MVESEEADPEYSGMMILLTGLSSLKIYKTAMYIGLNSIHLPLNHCLPVYPRQSPDAGVKRILPKNKEVKPGGDT
jgi:hypothetical protein